MLETLTTDAGSPMTLFLAKAIGFYFLAAGVGVMIAPQRWQSVMQEMKDQQTLVLLAGIMAYVLGIVILSVHRVWGEPLACIITAIGYIGVIKGLLLMIFPAPAMKLGEFMLGNMMMRVWSILIIALGAYMIYAGYSG